MDIISILRVLRTKIWILILIPLFSIICTTFLVLNMEKEYKSTAQFVAGLTSDDEVNLSEEKAFNLFETDSKFTNMMESLNSIPVMNLVSYRLILHDLESKEPFRNLKDKVSPDFEPTAKNLSEIKKIFKDHSENLTSLNSFNASDKMALSALVAYGYDYESLKDNFTTARQNLSDYISVEFLSENPQLSAFAANALCQEFFRFNKTLKTDRSSESIEFLEKLIEDKRHELDAKIATLNQFKINNNVVNYDAESTSKISQISKYELTKETEEKNISGLELSITMVENKIKSLSSLNKDEIISVNQRIIDLRKQINDLNYAKREEDKEKLNQLRDELQFEVSRVQSLDNEDYEQQVKDLNKELESLMLQLKIARANWNAVNRSLSGLVHDASGFATTEAQLSDLERDVKVASDEYQSATERFSAAKNKALVIGSKMRQIVEGQPSLEPEPSKGFLLTGLAGVCSFILCALGILIKEMVDFSIRTPFRLEIQTNLKNVGILNSFNLRTFDLQLLFESKSDDPDTELFINNLRKLRFEIQNSTGKIFLITSTQAKTGKSFIIICISYALSLLNKKVLIIDTNFKNNSLTRLLISKSKNVKLLDQVITNPADLQKHLSAGGVQIEKETEEFDLTDHNMIYSTKYKGVDVIGNFGGQDSPFEILAGRNFKQMLENLGVKYDFIIMEGPSMNEYSDTKELVSYADKVISVFDAKTALNNFDKESVKYLKSIKSKSLGTILNKVNLKDLAV